MRTFSELINILQAGWKALACSRSIDGPQSGCCKIDHIMVHFLCVLVTFHHIKNVCDGFKHIEREKSNEHQNHSTRNSVCFAAVIVTSPQHSLTGLNMSQTTKLKLDPTLFGRWINGQVTGACGRPFTVYWYCVFTKMTIHFL